VLFAFTNKFPASTVQEMNNVALEFRKSDINSALY